jgi:hypothetical protein
MSTPLTTVNRKTPFLKDLPLLVYGLGGAPSLAAVDPATVTLLSLVAEDYISGLLAAAYNASTVPKPPSSSTSSSSSSHSAPAAKRQKLLHALDFLSAVSTDADAYVRGVEILREKAAISDMLLSSNGVAKPVQEEWELEGGKGGGTGETTATRDKAE